MNRIALMLTAIASWVMTSCVSWRPLPEFNRWSLTSEVLVRELGPPHRLIEDLDHNKLGKVDEYRYYFIGRDGRTHAMQFWLRDGHWVSNSEIDSPFQKPREYRLLDMLNRTDQRLIDIHDRERPWLQTNRPNKSSHSNRH